MVAHLSSDLQVVSVKGHRSAYRRLAPLHLRNALRRRLLQQHPHGVCRQALGGHVPNLVRELQRALVCGGGRLVPRPAGVSVARQLMRYPKAEATPVDQCGPQRRRASSSLAP